MPAELLTTQNWNDATTTELLLTASCNVNQYSPRVQVSDWINQGRRSRLAIAHLSSFKGATASYAFMIVLLPWTTRLSSGEVFSGVGVGKTTTVVLKDALQ